MKYGGFLGIGNSIIEAFEDKLKAMPNFSSVLPSLKALSLATDTILLVGWILAIIAIMAAIIISQGTKIIFKDDAKKIDETKRWSKSCWISAIILFLVPAILPVALTIFVSAIG